MKEKMSKAGYTQGDMKPTVEDYQSQRKILLSVVSARLLSMSKDRISARLGCRKTSISRLIQADILNRRKQCLNEKILKVMSEIV